MFHFTIQAQGVVERTQLDEIIRLITHQFENDWTWDHNSFDLVHSRVLCGSVVDYTKLLKQAFDSIKPGGYIEMQDMLPAMSCDDDSCGKDDPIMTMGQYAAQAIRKSGRTLLELDEYKKHLEDAGFVNVKEVWLKRALNTWPKDPKMKQIGVVRIFSLCSPHQKWNVSPSRSNQGSNSTPCVRFSRASMD